MWNDPTGVRSYASIIKPLFALKDLEDVNICLANCVTSFTDTDVTALARAWSRVQKLHVGYYLVRVLPPARAPPAHLPPALRRALAPCWSSCA